MALDFPPSDQSPFEAPNGVTYVWDGNKWVASGIADGASVEISDTPPADPSEGALWWNSDDGRLYIWYEEVGGSSQWVDASPDGTPTYWTRSGTTLTPNTATDSVQLERDLQARSFNGGQLGGLRNWLDNGNFEWWQRPGVLDGTVNPNTATGGVGAFGPDRWLMSNAMDQFGRVTAAVNLPAGYTGWGLETRVAAGSTQVSIQQQHELRTGTLADPLAPMKSPFTAGTKYAMSCWLDADAGVTPQVRIMFTQGKTQSTNTIVQDWVNMTEVPGSAGGGTWKRWEYIWTGNENAPANDEVVVKFGFRAPGVGAGNSCKWAGMQFEESPVSTPFETIPPAIGLLRCQRYYQSIKSVPGNPAITFASGLWRNSNHLRLVIQLNPPMVRRSYDMSKSTHKDFRALHGSSAAELDNSTLNGLNLQAKNNTYATIDAYVTNANGPSSGGGGGGLRILSNAGAYIDFDAER